MTDNQVGDADTAGRVSHGTFVAPLAAFGRDDLDRAGGKGANLGELVRRGYPVPAGFVVTTDAYTAVVERAGLASRITERLAAGDDDGAAIRADFAAAEAPGEVLAAIRAGYADLGGSPVAVRSSATAEDLPGAAFAGQQDTYLGIVGERSVVEAVARCWASLWSERALAYRRRRGIRPDEVRIAVVVQRMVEAETAGVMFTANPVTGRRDETVLDANSGLGEAVVSGLVTPDHYVLDRTGKVRVRTQGGREVVIRGAAGGGVTEAAGGSDTGGLPEAALAELARLGSSVAGMFGRPQDIEWAYAGGTVHLLQARPMTALPPPPVRLNALQRRFGSALLDYLTQRPYPLDVTTWMEHGPLGMVTRMAASAGVRIDFMASLHEDEGVVDSFVPPMPHPTPAVLAAPFRLARRARRFDPARWTADPRYAEFERRSRALADRDLCALSWSELLRTLRELLSLTDYVTELRIDYLPRAGFALLRLALALRLLRYRGSMSDLLVSPTTTTATNDALVALADRVRADAQLRDAFAGLESGPLLEALRGEPRFAAFHAALRAFLAEYGHRETASPILVSPPTWRDAPETVLDLVRMTAESASAPADVDRGGAALRALRALRALLDRPGARGPAMRARLSRWVDAARQGVALREDTHFSFTRPLPRLRQALLEIGRRLCAAEVVAEPYDVFHLRLDELEELPAPADLPVPVADRLRDTVLARAAKRDELSGVRLIDVSAVFPGGADGSGVLVSGTPACGGRATGPVRVIRTPGEFGTLRAGDVLVCPYTNPAWTPLFQRAAAVVVDTGGLGSHAAIVAREYGIPTIMGTGVATTTLTDGQLVTVDGDLGQVRRIDRDEPRVPT